MFIESSKDILYIVLSVCVLWATVFLCWMLYYVMKILKNTSQIIEEFRVRLETISTIISSIQNKIDNISGIMNLFTEGFGGMVRKVVTKKAEQWVDTGTDSLNSVAKEAVDKAVGATAARMKTMTKKIKK